MLKNFLQTLELRNNISFNAYKLINYIYISQISYSKFQIDQNNFIMKFAKQSSHMQFDDVEEKKPKKRIIRVSEQKQMQKSEKKKKILSFNDEQVTVRKVVPNLIVQQNDQEEFDSDNQNSFSLALKELVELKGRAKVQKKREEICNEEKIAKIQNTLMKYITVITPFRIRASEFCEQLKIFRFEKMKKNAFGESEDRIEKYKHYLLRTITDLFQKYRNSRTNKFYIITTKSSFYYFYHVGKHLLLISSSGQNLEKSLKSEKINYQFSHNMGQSIEKEYIIIKEKNLQIFWNYYINDLLKKDTPFEIVANYSFVGSTEFMPREIFNGNENRDTFDELKIEIGQQQVSLNNIFLEINPNLKKNRLFNMKIQGYFMRENIEALNQKLKKKMKFELLFNEHNDTEKYNQMLIEWNKSKQNIMEPEI